MKHFWDERYAKNEYAYGKEPNQFLKENLQFIPRGKILFVAEGEGRNAIFAAQNGFEVSAFDYSESGQKKALRLASENNVEISYVVSDVLELSYNENSFDAIVLIFAHFPSGFRKEAHLKLLTYLKPNGTILFEAFSKEQLNYASGGPKDSSMLFSGEEVKSEFEGVKFDFLKTEIALFNEGPHHQGEGSVIRFVGTKL